ncbi:MAG: diaminopimelate epimerase [Lentisphaerae bacterium GWF2_52_8]|nr:MAG: diaminopimelate epimerase [Lentisphaerae bacterium GWF2_52_8]
MKKLFFTKMHGAGNDFIVMHGAEAKLSPGFIRSVCHRQRGVGADGLILLSPGTPPADLQMNFYNNDGLPAGMCGNGLRCAGLYAWEKKLVQKNEMLFDTGAGRLGAEICGKGLVRIELKLLEPFRALNVAGWTLYFGNTGVPHAVVPLPDALSIDVATEGRTLRNHAAFAPAGTNVNFISLPADTSAPILIRTYERGVEAETQACGTGITAAAVSAALFLDRKPPLRFITTNSDVLTVDMSIADNIVSGIRLTGPALSVFEGEIPVEFLTDDN